MISYQGTDRGLRAGDATPASQDASEEERDAVFEDVDFLREQPLSTADARATAPRPCR